MVRANTGQTRLIFENIYLLHVQDGKRGLWGLFNSFNSEISFWIVGPAGNQVNLENTFSKALQENEVDV